MSKIGSWRTWHLAAAAVAALAVSSFGLTPASAQTGPVSAVPAAGTPQLAATGTTEQVKQIAQCGGTMYAVGSFTSIKQRKTTYARTNIFSFSATKPYTVTSWDPDVNGVIDTIAFNGSNCSDAYIGGSFTSVGGTAVKNIAEIDTTTGDVVPGFSVNTNGQIETLLAVNGHLLVGGLFTSIDGSSTDSYYASLNPTTGANDGYLNLSISGTYVYKNAKPNVTQVANQQLSPNGEDVLVEGVFTSVGGMALQQIFMMSLGTSAATVTDWSSADFSDHCSRHAFNLTSAAWSPDSSTVYVVSTGHSPAGWVKGTFPLTGLCGAVAAFPATQAAGLTPTWINYTGCDSLDSVAADSSAVYVAGTERWADNANGCDRAGTGAVTAPGMGGFTPSSGDLLENSAATAGEYSRARGLGADDMLLTSTGLWIASDNLDGSATCGGVGGHAGICYLPYS
jgi:hypothetical protein